MGKGRKGVPLEAGAAKFGKPRSPSFLFVLWPFLLDPSAAFFRKFRDGILVDHSVLQSEVGLVAIDFDKDGIEPKTQKEREEGVASSGADGSDTVGQMAQRATDLGDKI